MRGTERWWVQHSRIGASWVAWRRGDPFTTYHFATHAEAIAYADRRARMTVKECAPVTSRASECGCGRDTMCAWNTVASIQALMEEM